MLGAWDDGPFLTSLLKKLVGMVERVGGRTDSHRELCSAGMVYGWGEGTVSYELWINPKREVVVGIGNRTRLPKTVHTRRGECQQRGESQQMIVQAADGLVTTA